MVDFYENESECRRAVLLRHFGEDSSSTSSTNGGCQSNNDQRQQFPLGRFSDLERLSATTVLALPARPSEVGLWPLSRSVYVAEMNHSIVS